MVRPLSPGTSLQTQIEIARIIGTKNPSHCRSDGHDLLANYHKLWSNGALPKESILPKNSETCPKSPE